MSVHVPGLRRGQRGVKRGTVRMFGKLNRSTVCPAFLSAAGQAVNGPDYRALREHESVGDWQPGAILMGPAPQR